MNKEKILKTTLCGDRPTEDQWFKEFGVSKGYVTPTKYYQGNDLRMDKFTGHADHSKVSWHKQLLSILNLNN